MVTVLTLSPGRDASMQKLDEDSTPELDASMHRLDSSMLFEGGTMRHRLKDQECIEPRCTRCTRCDVLDAYPTQALKRLEWLDALHMCRTVVFFRSSVCLLQNTHLNLSTTFETYSTCDMLIMTMHVCAVLWTEVVS